MIKLVGDWVALYIPTMTKPKTDKAVQGLALVATIHFSAAPYIGLDADYGKEPDAPTVASIAVSSTSSYDHSWNTMSDSVISTWPVKIPSKSNSDES